MSPYLIISNSSCVIGYRTDKAMIEVLPQATRFWGLAHLGLGNFSMQLFISYNENIMSVRCGLTL